LIRYPIGCEAAGIYLDDHSYPVKWAMLMTTRKPATVGEILSEEFKEPMGMTQGALAQAMGVARKHVNELRNNRRTVTAPTALILAPRLRQQSGILAERAAPHRSVGSDSLAQRSV